MLIGCRRRGGAAERTVVMGRSMTGRVIPYAEKNGYAYYGGTTKIIPRALERLAPNTTKKVALWFDKRWINGEGNAGSRVIDIGEPPARHPATSTGWNSGKSAATGTHPPVGAAALPRARRHRPRRGEERRDAAVDNGQTTCRWCAGSKGARDFPANPPPGYEGGWPPPWWDILR